MILGERTTRSVEEGKKERVEFREFNFTGQFGIEKSIEEYGDRREYRAKKF